MRGEMLLGRLTWMRIAEFASAYVLVSSVAAMSWFAVAISPLGATGEWWLLAVDALILIAAASVGLLLVYRPQRRWAYETLVASVLGAIVTVVLVALVAIPYVEVAVTAGLALVGLVGSWAIAVRTRSTSSWVVAAAVTAGIVAYVLWIVWSQHYEAFLLGTTDLNAHEPEFATYLESAVFIFIPLYGLGASAVMSVRSMLRSRVEQALPASGGYAGQ